MLQSNIVFIINVTSAIIASIVALIAIIIIRKSKSQLEEYRASRKKAKEEYKIKAEKLEKNKFGEDHDHD
ncbi:hypothetical protein [Rahnella aceris]|uniref:hypothetical protein n=1 Tax=Rahnella sp. (strain Y9602) TaxID=2703885 RepID=UPI003FD0654E